MGGLSLLLIERSMPGVSTRQMACSGVWASGTSYVTFEDVKVPVENLIGKENKGFKAIMVNFMRFDNSTTLITKEWELLCKQHALQEFVLKIQLNMRKFPLIFIF